MKPSKFVRVVPNPIEALQVQEDNIGSVLKYMGIENNLTAIKRCFFTLKYIPIVCVHNKSDVKHPFLDDWIIKHGDGTIEVMDDEKFKRKYKEM